MMRSKNQVESIPSFEARPDGKPPGPDWRYAVHFRQSGPGVLPSVPPQLERCAIGGSRVLDYARSMNANLRKLPIDERIRLVEDLWDSIAADQSALPLTADQRTELDRRLDAYQADGNLGRPAADVIAEIRKKL